MEQNVKMKANNTAFLTLQDKLQESSKTFVYETWTFVAISPVSEDDDSSQPDSVTQVLWKENIVRLLLCKCNIADKSLVNSF